jgi:hypothetical protein
LTSPPGTVSKILWHFTGGPKWNAKKNCQEQRPKPSTEAYVALLSILESRQLRLGAYREVVKVQVPDLRRTNPRTAVNECAKIVEVSSSPVCCVADIPIAHLSYHAGRYGRIAIGFHREAAVRQGFNPVFYSLHGSRVLRSLYEGCAKLGDFDTEGAWSVARRVASDLEDLKCAHGHVIDMSTGQAFSVQVDIEDIGDVVAKALKELRRFLAYVKTFNEDEFSTIYPEREWRSVDHFSFKTSDVAMVVLPKQGGDESFFRRFLSEATASGIHQEGIPVVPWEDLIEH